jgi:hypothetical protein
MRFRLLLPVVLSLGVMLLLVGCPPEDYATLLPPTLPEIKRIHDDPNMPVAEMRSRLAELGLDPVTINALLQDKPLGNQFGGTLRTAYEKLVAPDFTALTPDEIQLFALQASQIDTTLNVQFTDEQAQALVVWFRDNSLFSPQDVTTYLDTPGNSAPSVITDEDQVIRSLFVDFDFSLLLPELP